MNVGVQHLPLDELKPLGNAPHGLLNAVHIIYTGDAIRAAGVETPGIGKLIPYRGFY